MHMINEIFLATIQILKIHGDPLSLQNETRVIVIRRKLFIGVSLHRESRYLTVKF